MLAMFAVMMGLSGAGLQTLGVPLGTFFSFSKPAMAGTAVCLALLSWANFALLVFARSVFQIYITRVRKKLLGEYGLLATGFEIGFSVLLIWAWVLGDFLPAGIASTLVTTAGFGVLCTAVFLRHWDWMDDLKFPHAVIWGLVLWTVSSIAVALAGPGMAASAFWLVLLGVIAALSPSPISGAYDRSETLPWWVIVRHSGRKISMQPWRIGLAAVALLCVLPELAKTIGFPVDGLVLALVNGALLTALVVELCLLGGIGTTTRSRHNAYGVAILASAACVGFTKLAAIENFVTWAIPICLSVLLLWCSVRELRNPKSG